MSVRAAAFVLFRTRAADSVAGWPRADFGYMDGIDQPAVAGFTTPVPGQTVVDPELILLGEPGDAVPRPAWAKDGAFLAFRQLVPEFDKFVTDTRS
jgi:deferrochelatase/peroxidase EfeB